MSVSGIMSVLTFLLVGATLWLVPSLSRRDQFFGVTVPPAFRATPVARGILWRYRSWVAAQCVLAWIAFVEVAPAALAPASGAPASGAPAAGAFAPGALAADLRAWSWLAFLWPLLATLPALLWARRAVLPYAAPPATVARVRLASLRERPRPLPGGLSAWIGPPVVLALAAAYLALRWSAIPPRFAIHWGLDGAANGWADRSLGGVFESLAVGLAGYLTLLFTVWQIGRQARGSEAMRVYTGRALLTAAYLLAFTFAGLSITLPFRAAGAGPGMVPNVILALVALFVVGLIVLGRRLRDTPLPSAAAAPDAKASLDAKASSDPSSADRRWLAGILYFNREDPAVFVEKRLGLGYTVNFARPSAWLYLGLVLLVPLVLLLTGLH
jgi:uncharacterized membrane protein